MQILMQVKNTFKLHRRFILNFLYNTGGIAFYLCCKWIITILSARWSENFETAGTLALAISITNIFSCVATFSIRSYQVSDKTGLFTDGDYITTRYVTCSLALFFCFVYSMFFVVSWIKRIAVMLYMVIVFFESLTDVFHGIEQKMYKMNLICISFLLRGIAILSVFCLLFNKTSVLWVIAAMAAVTMIVVLLYDVLALRKVTHVYFSKDVNQILTLLKNCSPLFLVGVINVVMTSVTRNIIELKYGVELLGVYTSVTIPTVIIQMCANFIFIPFINVFTDFVYARDKAGFVRWSLIIVIAIIVLIGLFGIVVYFKGAFLLEKMYGAKALNYSYLLLTATPVAGSTAILWFLTTLLIVLRKIKIQLAANMVGAIICLSLTPVFLENYGLVGANVSQTIGVVATIIMLAANLLKFYFKGFGNNKI